MADEIKNIPIYGDSKPAPEVVETPASEKPEQQQSTQKIVVTTAEGIKYKIILWIVLGLLFAGIAFFAGNYIYDYFHNPVIITEKDKVSTPADAKKMVELKAGFKISDWQGKEIAQTMNDSTPGTSNYKEPDKVVVTNGKDYKDVIEQEKKNAGADVAIVTPKDPNKKADDIKKNDTVVLEQRNYKLFPKSEWGMNSYNDGSFSVDYQERVKVFGTTAYVGASILYDKPGKDVKYGVRLAFPR